MGKRANLQAQQSSSLASASLLYWLALLGMFPSVRFKPDHTLIQTYISMLHGWAKATGYYKTNKAKRWATIVVILYHIAVMTAIAIYATGQSNAAKPSTHSSGQTMAEAGVLLLLLLLLFLVGAFIVLMATSRMHPLRPILFAIAISLLLLKIRLIFQCVAVFRNYNYSTESIALKVIFQFLPGAFILLALVTGGVMSAGKQKEIYEAVRTDIPLAAQSSG